MPRIRIDAPVSIPALQDLDDEQGESLDVALSTTKDKPKCKSSGVSPSKIDRAFKEFDELFKTGVWKTNPEKLRPDHAVAFYARLHEKIYKVFPEELRDGKVWMGACSAIRRMIASDNREFDNGTKLFEFILWTWQKEKDRVDWLRKNDKPIHKRITWRDQFVMRYRLTDYRQAMAEAKERGNRR